MGASQESSRIPPLDEAQVDLKSLRNEARLAIVNCLDEVWIVEEIDDSS